MNERNAITLEGAAADRMLDLLAGHPARQNGTKTKRPKAPTFFSVLTSIFMLHTVYTAVLREMTKRPPEFGGLLLGPTGHHIVTHFLPDTTGTPSPVQFEFDHARLNTILRQYVPLEVEALGFVHSHPPGYTRLSRGDIEAATQPFRNPKNDVERVLMSIVVDGELYPYVVTRDGTAHKAELILI